MGGKGSGNFNQISVKNGTYKIFAFEQNGVEFYYGVAKGFLCKTKAYYIYRAKNRVQDTVKNKVFDYIESIDYKFKIIQKEILPGYTSKEARLLLQEKYLNCKDKNIILNVLNYCFCNNHISKNPRLSQELRESIINDYINGIRTGEIAIKYNIPKNKITTLMRTNKVNKKKQFEKAVQDYKDGMPYNEVVEKYHLLKHMQEKLIKVNEIH